MFLLLRYGTCVVLGYVNFCVDCWLYSFCSVTLRSGQTCCYYEANFKLLCYLLRFVWCWDWLLYDIVDICTALVRVLVFLVVVCLCILCDAMCWAWLYRSRYMLAPVCAQRILLLHVLILWQLSHQLKFHIEPQFLHLWRWNLIFKNDFHKYEEKLMQLGRIFRLGP